MDSQMHLMSVRSQPVASMAARLACCAQRGKLLSGVWGRAIAGIAVASNMGKALRLWRYIL
jgi:hypothetical protein